MSKINKLLELQKMSTTEFCEGKFRHIYALTLNLFVNNCDNEHYLLLL